ncbi:hypothetical protein HDE_00397 [Halotydeus destructor]|nr:hypothetical protein HDE_00397 [Halotydeus destructor]
MAIKWSLAIFGLFLLVATISCTENTNSTQTTSKPNPELKSITVETISNETESGSAVTPSQAKDDLKYPKTVEKPKASVKLYKGHPMLVGKPLPLLSRAARVHPAHDMTRTRRSLNKHRLESKLNQEQDMDPREMLALLAILSQAKEEEQQRDTSGLDSLLFGSDADIRPADSIKNSVPFVFGRPIQAVLSTAKEPEEEDAEYVYVPSSAFARSRQSSLHRKDHSKNPNGHGHSDIRRHEPDWRNFLPDREPEVPLGFNGRNDAEEEAAQLAAIYTLGNLLTGQSQRNYYDVDDRRKRSTNPVHFM